MTQILKPASQIIKKFGGIRPMATKTGIAVTTVQGWKNRNSIPENRVEEILAAAEKHGIHTESLLVTPETAHKPYVEKHTPIVDIDDPVEGERAWQVTENIHQNNIRTTVIGGLSIALALIALVVAFFAFDRNKVDAPDYDYTLAEFEQRLMAQQSETERRIEALNTQLKQQHATTAETQATREEIAQFQSQLENLKLALSKDDTGKAGFAQLENTVQGLKDNVDSLRTKLTQIQDYAAQTGISGTDVKATSMLVVLSQLRNAFNREQPFSEDLALLQKIFNTENDPELAAALQRLAPHADTGVISAQGLKSELGGLTNEVITASLMDEDVSIQDKAMARINKIVQITKDGVPVTGTQTDQTMAQAQQYLDQNDIGGAVGVLQQLNPQALSVLGPWMQKAQGTMAAGNVEDIISRRIVGMVRQYTPGAKGSIVQYGAAPINPVMPIQPKQESQIPPVPLMDLQQNQQPQ
ncbi:MAG: hypothetical protein CMH30_01705 [Micavibrio sp.]|nr:hypothetical protein [Micavibrio sp.]